MPLDPDAQRMLDDTLKANLAPMESLTPAELRSRTRALREARNLPKPEVEVSEHDADGVPVRLYRSSEAPTPAPVVVFFHGGGWVIGDLESHDLLCRHIAVRARCAVAAVDYRLAPEHPFPAAIDDAYAATAWTARQAARLGLDPGRLAVAGDSAGGNLAAVVALMARDAGPKIVLQALLYPVVDNVGRYPSYASMGEGYFLTHSAMQWFRDQYLKTEADRADWRASPILADDLSGAPPAYVATALYDPLADEGEAYAGALEAAGVVTAHRCFTGQMHGFGSWPGVLAAADDVLDEMAEALRAAWGA